MKSSLDTAYLVKHAPYNTFGATIGYNETAGQTTSAQGPVQSSVPSPIQAPAPAINVTDPQPIKLTQTPTL